MRCSTSDALYVSAYLTSLEIAAISTGSCSLIGLPDRLRHGARAAPLAPLL